MTRQISHARYPALRIDENVVWALHVGRLELSTSIPGSRGSISTVIPLALSRNHSAVRSRGEKQLRTRQSAQLALRLTPAQPQGFGGSL